MLLIFILIIIIAFFVRFRHTKIKWKTFFKKGFTPNRGIFGVYCYCGKQGQGKTYSVVEFILKNSDKRVYGNLKSLDHYENYTYFNGFYELLNLRSESDCIIFYDEIFTALTKSSRVDNEVLDFLSQMRKRKIIFLTTAQEWLEIPMTLRRYCRYQIDCTMRSMFNLGILVKRCYDAEHMSWSKDDNEYVAPLVETTISKCNLYVANAYDTFEQIKT